MHAHTHKRERESQRNSLKRFIVKDETISLALEKASEAPELTSTGRSPNKSQAKAAPQRQDTVTIDYSSWKLSTNLSISSTQFNILVIFFSHSSWKQGDLTI